MLTMHEKESTKTLHTNVLVNLSQQQQYVLRMHANVMSADKIKRQTEKQGYALLDFYRKPSERQIIKKMKPGQVCVIVQTQPPYYAGAIALAAVQDVAPGPQLRVRFLSYLGRVVSIEQLRGVDSRLAPSPVQVVCINEDAFYQIVRLASE